MVVFLVRQTIVEEELLDLIGIARGEKVSTFLWTMVSTEPEAR